MSRMSGSVRSRHFIDRIRFGVEKTYLKKRIPKPGVRGGRFFPFCRALIFSYGHNIFWRLTSSHLTTFTSGSDMRGHELRTLRGPKKQKFHFFEVLHGFWMLNWYLAERAWISKNHYWLTFVFIESVLSPVRSPRLFQTIDMIIWKLSNTHMMLYGGVENILRAIVIALSSWENPLYLKSVLCVH